MAQFRQASRDATSSTLPLWSLTCEMIDPDCLIFSDCEMHRMRRFRIIRSLYCIPMRLHSSPGMLRDSLLSHLQDGVSQEDRISLQSSTGIDGIGLCFFSSRSRLV